MNNSKLAPFDRLKSILNDGDISDKAYENIDKLFKKEDEKKESLWVKIKSFFLTIDKKIFTKPSKKWNTYYHKR